MYWLVVWVHCDRSSTQTCFNERKKQHLFPAKASGWRTWAQLDRGHQRSKSDLGFSLFLSRAWPPSQVASFSCRPGLYLTSVTNPSKENEPFPKVSAKNHLGQESVWKQSRAKEVEGCHWPGDRLCAHCWRPVGQPGQTHPPLCRSQWPPLRVADGWFPNGNWGALTRKVGKESGARITPQLSPVDLVLPLYTL